MLDSDKEIDELNKYKYKVEGELEKHGKPLQKR